MNENLAFEAMSYARHVHRDQKRKYTGQPYFDHLAEVAGIVASVSTGWKYYSGDLIIGIEQVLAVAYLHDSREDQDVSFVELEECFGMVVADGVTWLSDFEKGNRETRKLLSRERLAKAPAWIQTIKYADLISNTSSIVQHDPDFAIVYLKEKRQLLEVMDKGDQRLYKLACELAKGE